MCVTVFRLQYCDRGGIQSTFVEFQYPVNSGFYQWCGFGLFISKNQRSNRKKNLQTITLLSVAFLQNEVSFCKYLINNKQKHRVFCCVRLHIILKIEAVISCETFVTIFRPQGDITQDMVSQTMVGVPLLVHQMPCDINKI